MLKILQIRHAWPEKAGFSLVREAWNKDYIFLHFFNSVEISFNGKTIVTEPNSVIIFRPQTHHSFKSDTPLTHNWFHFSVDDEATVEKLGLKFDTIYNISYGDFITKIVRALENEFFSPRLCSKEYVTAKVSELFIRIAREATGDGRANIDKSLANRLDELRAEMFLSLDRQWTVAKMAAAVGLSESRFYTVYKQVFGNSPVDDLIRARMESAKSSLLGSGDSVNDIAESLGYNNTTHFIRQFKACYGVSPLIFRKENK